MTTFKRIAALVIALAAINPLFAAAPCTKIVDTLYLPTGQPVPAATITLTLTSSGSASTIVSGAPTVIKVAQGKVTACQVPGTYAVQYAIAGVPNATGEVWIVPTSGSPVTVASVLQTQNNSLASSVMNFADQETPTGTIDGTNAAFTLAHSPVPASSLILLRNGLGMKQGFDYTITGNAITFVSGAVPQAGDTLLAWYRY